MKTYFIEPLSPSVINNVELLLNKIFDDSKDEEKAIVMASLNPILHKDIFSHNNIKTAEYWVLKDKKTDKTIGLTGLYQELNDFENICWLGWFCVDESYRRKGLGKKLLDFSIQQAKNLKKKYLHLYTFNSKKYHPAIQMYKNYGFNEYTYSRDTQDLYLKKDI